MDMPTVISAEALNSIDFNDISSKIENYSPVIDVVKKTWTKESLLDILSGKISIPDDVINASIAEQIDETSKVKSLTVSSQANGKLKINADTRHVSYFVLWQQGPDGRLLDPDRAGDTGRRG